MSLDGCGFPARPTRVPLVAALLSEMDFSWGQPRDADAARKGSCWACRCVRPVLTGHGPLSRGVRLECHARLRMIDVLLWSRPQRLRCLGGRSALPPHPGGWTTARPSHDGGAFGAASVVTTPVVCGALPPTAPLLLPGLDACSCTATDNPHARAPAV